MSEVRTELNWSRSPAIVSAISHFSRLQYHVRAVGSLIENGPNWGTTNLVCVGLSECSTSWLNYFSYPYNLSSPQPPGVNASEPFFTGAIKKTTRIGGRLIFLAPV